MKNLKNQKGITLVALVVTIIVLLILAGVSLNLVAGSDGILNKASNSVSKTNKAAAIEQADLLIAEYKADYLEDKYTNGNSQSFEAYLASKLTGNNINLPDKSQLTIDGTELTLTLQGTTSGEDGDKVKNTATVGSNGSVTAWQGWSDEKTTNPDQT